MIIYKTYGIDFLPRPLWWISNNLYLLFIFLMLLLMLATGLFMQGMMSVLPFVMWAVIMFAVFLHINRKARPCQIAIDDESVVFTCSKFFAVFDVAVPSSVLRLELYKSKQYRGNYSGAAFERYLYFSSSSDNQLWIELNAPFYTLGAVLHALAEKGNIAMGTRELNFIAQYHEKMKTYNTPRARIIRISVPLVSLVLIALIVYQCAGM